MTDRKSAPDPAEGGIDELVALLRGGGFWRLAPEWVPRGGYAAPTPEVLRAVEEGLRRNNT
ncbi:hypothetical protein [Streptomyces sp. NPDC004726]